MICRGTMVLALAHVAVHLGTALKIEPLRTPDVEHELVALHVKLHNTVAGLRQQLNNNGELRKAPVLPMLIKFQKGLEQILSDTVYMTNKRDALAELRSADSSVERLITPYTTWEASHHTYKMVSDAGILLEANKTASSLETQISKMEKAFRVKKRRHEKRLKALRIHVSASATKLNNGALEREEKSFNKLLGKHSMYFAKMRSAVDAVKKKDPNVLFAFVRAVHDATVNDDLHATPIQ